MTAVAGTSRYTLFTFALSFDLYAELKVIVFYRLTHSYAASATLIALTLLTSALADVPTGLLSDRAGRKLTIAAGAIFLLAGYLFFAVDASQAQLAAGAVCEGLALALFSGNNNAYLHNLLSAADSQDAFHHHYGRVMSVKTLASVLGILAGGAMLMLSVTLLLWVNLIPKLVCVATALLLKRTPRHDGVQSNVSTHLAEASGLMRSNLTVRWASLATIVGGSGFAAGELQAAAFAAVWPAWAVGVAKAVQSVAGIPGYFYAGRLIDRFGEARLTFVSLVTSVSGNVLTGAIRSGISPLFVMLSLPLYGPADTARERVLQREFIESQRATVASVNSFGNSISAALALYICGRIASRYGPFTALIATQVLLIPAIYFQFLFMRRLRRRASE